MDRNKNVFLIVADETTEFEHALQYGAHAAKANGAALGILFIMDNVDFTHWGGVEDRIQQELRQEAEQFLLKVATRLQDTQQQIAGFYLEQGSKIDAVSKTLENNKEITKLILGANSHSSDPGQLVSYFAGKGVPNLSVPLTIVPDHLDREDMRRLI